MKNNNRKEVRKSSPKVIIERTKENLTSQSGLVSVMKFLDKIGLSSAIKTTGEHVRGANAAYKLSDAVYLTVLGIIGGVKYISGIISIWSDSVLMRLAGWLFIPVDTTRTKISIETINKGGGMS